MTPRLDMAAVSKDATVKEAIETCMRSRHARLPAYADSLDNVIGIFDIRELEDSNYDDFSDLKVEDVVASTLYVPESKKVDDLLAEMRENRKHMVMVIDEFGATEGLITMEDVLEEIVGEILVGDEEHPIEFVDDNEILVQGEVNIHEVNEALDIDLPEGEEFETIAGFIFNLAGRLVEQDEVFDYENVKLRAEKLEETRIKEVRVTVERDTVESVEDEVPATEDEME
jgi:Hemolysins and related proteins containing CBS domains